MLPEPAAGIFHVVAQDPTISAFEFSPSPSPLKHLVVFVGGLSDSILSVPYASRLAAGLREHGWGLAQAQLRSTGDAFGGCTVTQDAEQLGQIVDYFRRRGVDKVVLMGHSTGCQDAIAYLHLRQPSSLPSLDGVILQAPVSDREPLEHWYPGQADLPPSLENMDDFIPSSQSKIYFTCGGIRARRWKSLTAKPDTDVVDIDVSEDFFSSDLSDARLANVFRPLACPLLTLLGGNDGAYPPHVKEKLPELLGRFKAACPEAKLWSEQSGIIPGGSHNLEEEEGAKVMVDRVVKFVQGL
ncbi:hypothetical protein JCM8097_004853 [Rhodosporidiobolus ruineniae]